MTINSVNGLIEKEDLGTTLVHEHLFLDQSNFNAIEANGEEITLENLWKIKRDPYLSPSNCVLDDVTEAINEVNYFKNEGGNTIVEVTNCGMGRDVDKLKHLSSATGLNVITSTGFYVETSHPPHINDASIEELSEFMLKELEEGIEQTNIKAGIIGEIGTSTTITKNEEKVLRAAARCHKKGNYPISIHLSNMKGREGLNVIKILDNEGANLNKVVLCHMDLALDDYDYQIDLAKTGVFIEYDSFGMEFTIDSRGFAFYRDADKIVFLKKLIDDGFVDKLLVSQDVCFKICLKKYGGQGYDHLLRNIFPLYDQYKSIDLKEKLLIQNPNHWLFD